MGFATRFSVPPVDATGAAERAGSFTKRSIKRESKGEGLRLAVSLMDLTTLEGADTEGKVTHLCRKARQPMAVRFNCPPCAAVCVYPTLVAHAKRELEGSSLGVAAVATGFPSGQFPLDVRLADVRAAVEAGADEIDMVISRGAFLAGKYDVVANEVAETKAACGEAHLKVIFETGELGSLDAVRLASQIAMEAGADFIKTSTGKVSPAATLPVTLVMLQAVRDFHAATGRRVGVKPAGGIRKAKEALQYLVMVKETVGEEWLTPALFRFGASSLLADVERQIAKLEDGNYQSARDFSKG